MKKVLLFLVLGLGIGLNVSADITFHVEDRDPIFPGMTPQPAQDVFSSLLRSYNFEVRQTDVPEYLNGIIKTSLDGEKLVSFDNSAFCKGLITAYAKHRAVVLSPDLIWLLISQSFASYVNHNSEKLRDRLVFHQGKMELVANSAANLFENPADEVWHSIFDQFGEQISENTKDGIAELVTADFSTTGPDERVVSQITLMEAVKSYFNYTVMYAACGIPDITLTGTPEDWRRVREKAAGLGKYGLDWWIDELDPILEQFVRASEGNPDVRFWQQMVKKRTPKEVVLATCDPNQSLTEFDGWFLKFYPYDKNGKKTPSKIRYSNNMRAEMTKTPFKYVITDETGTVVLGEYNMELWAGIIGIQEDPETGAYTPRMGWMVRQDMTEDDMYERWRSKAEGGKIKISSSYDFPQFLQKFDRIDSLEVNFSSVPNAPDWLKDISIGHLKITGKVFDDKRLRAVSQTYPEDAELDISIFDMSALE